MIGASVSLINKMHKGDPACSLKIGDQVYKHAAEKGDKHEIGETGVVTGSMAAFGKEAYLVKFGDSLIETFILKDKIDKI